MMDNLAANKSHIPCQSWADQNGWSTTSTQGPHFNPLPSSHHLSQGLSSGQRPSYDHLQASNQSCMIDLSTSSSTHHAALFKASHNSSSSTVLFADTAIPSSSHCISYVQQSPHTSSMLLTANQGKNIPPLSLPQTTQAPQPCRSQQLPLLSANNSYKTVFDLPLTNQGLPNGHPDLPISLPSCGQQGVSTSQATSGIVNLGFAEVSGNIHSHSSTTSQEQCQWMPSSHCRGAANESVPDASAHPNKETSQEGNIPPPASDERRRLVLLHQRAQLLQQLAELDKCLETVSPDDSSDGQSPQTANQFRTSMDDSSQCEQNKTSDTQQVQLLKTETCDKPEDLMSEAESEKKENLSEKLEDDCDPDYLPNRDSDFSDNLADPDGSSSDESSHSTPSVTTDERPSLPVKKRAKFGIPKASIHPPKRICATNLKKVSETPVLSCSNSKEKRVYDRRNYCLFCSKSVSKMSRHLERIHSDKTEVAAAFQHPQNSKERQKIWHRLINQGNFAHNKNVLKTGKGILAVRKRPYHTRKAGDFLHCLYCRGLFVNTALPRHMKSCPEKVKNENDSRFGRRIIASRCVLEASDDLGITSGLKSILSQMIYNDVTKTVLDDELILQFGEFLFDQHGSDVKKHEYIRQNLRQIARLVLEAQKITPLKKLEDFFLPSNFPHVVSAVNILAGYDAENKRYSIPSLAIKLGYHLQKVCNIVQENAANCGDASLAESAQNFLSEYQKNWNKLISGGALTTLRKNKLKKGKKVPFAQDVKRLIFYMENAHRLAEENLRDSPSTENYVALVKVILARTLIFNRRRSSEVSLLQLTDFMSKKKSNVDASMDISVSDLERSMCEYFTRIDIQGRCGRLVPVLLKPSFISAMDLFVNTRETCGVPSENLFLFARPNALSAYKGAVCIQKYVKECGAQDPKTLTLAKIRKHCATMLQLINLDENEADQILGPNNQVQTLRQDSSMQLDDVERYLEERLQLGTKGANKGKKGAKNTHKHKWEEAEVLAVERHLMRFIKRHKVPQKNDCIACIEAESEALRNRSWKGVKDYVRNRITAQKYVKKSGAKDPKELTSAEIRKEHTTQQQMNLDENEAGQTSGPNDQAQTLRQDSGQLDDLKRDSDGAKNTHKHKWKKAEVQAVERHMMRFIKRHKVPQKNDCIECLEDEPEALRNRSWKGVKDYVRNRITALKCVKKSGTKDPEALTSAEIRKHHTTQQQINLHENEAGQILHPNNKGQTLQQSSGMQQDGVKTHSDGVARGQQAASWNHNEHPGAHCGSEFSHERAHRATTRAKMTVPPKSSNSSKKGAQNNGKHKWGEAEVLAVERHMMRFIQGHKIPQKNDCIQCLEAEPEALRARSWKGVKDYVRNRITALTRQSGTSQATSTNSNWRGQEEPQQSQLYWTN